MALDVARDAYHVHRQEQLAREALDDPSGSVLSSQSQSLSQRFKDASTMEAQPRQELGEEASIYGSPRTIQGDRYGGQQIQPPPRTSSNSRTSGVAGPGTPTNERVRGPRDYRSPATPRSKSAGGQEQISSPKITSTSPYPGPGQENPGQKSPVYQSPTLHPQSSTPVTKRPEASQMQEASLRQAPSESTPSNNRRERSKASRSYESPTYFSNPTPNDSVSPTVEDTRQSHAHYSSSQYASPSAHAQFVPQANGPPEPRTHRIPALEPSTRNNDQGVSAGTPRESGEVLNRVVISDPEVDIKREEERIEEVIPSSQHAENPPKASKRRQDFSAHASKRKEAKFGEYILGQTLGEGEFGKVKLGWKKDGSVEVAIKLIRRENLNANPTRLPKIYREVNILRGLQHPHIVRLHEMLETDRFIGIVMECASGGELFDYILHHRYLKDTPAKKLFSQLISGVGYLHKVGIVHRDLKLENLLLDRSRNIIITDFGFANTFDPTDELSETVEEHITDKAWVKKHDLDKTSKHTGLRRGDLMATSCGSPCYAAPELVVTDSLYTGRKVDVWSCGVILYAMLAGYLPFDDDPANPEGDNINLLYKYIVSTPLTFPEYVSPHSRDLLRRMLVPDPRKRADLFEVARHSWLSEYASLILQYTSMSTESRTLPIVPITQEKNAGPSLARSASVREPSKPYPSTPPTIGGLTHSGKLDAQADSQRAPRDPKRRTVQVEYVAPQSQTVRGEDPVSTDAQYYAAAQAFQPSPSEAARQPPARKPVSSGQAFNNPTQPIRNVTGTGAYQSQYSPDMGPPPSRPMRDPPRSISDSTSAFGQYTANAPARPNTRGSISSASGGRLPSRGNSYSQPLAPTVAATNAQGRLAQPKGPRYNISAPIPQPEPDIQEPVNRPASQRLPSRQVPTSVDTTQGKSHKRSSTLSNIFGKSGSLFGGSKSQVQTPTEFEKSQKKYPPTSMRGPITTGSTPRVSSESRRTEPRRTSFGFSRKSSDVSRHDKPRRFSLLPPSFSLKNFSTGPRDSSVTSPGMEPNSIQYESTNSPTYDDQQQMPRNISEPAVVQPRTRVLQKSQRNFSEAYGQEDSAKHAGSSGPARRVMDFFRRRGKARAGED